MRLLASFNVLQTENRQKLACLCKGLYGVIFIVVMLSTPSAFAFYTVQDTGELLKAEQWQAAGALQFVTSGDDGINILGRMDKGFNEESNFRAEVGTGTTSMLLGGYYKWVPFPDFENQPAIGFTFGAHYARYSSENELSLRIIPFVSKKFDSDMGELTPYASLPFALQNYDSETNVPFQFVLGSRYRYPEFAHCDFNLELGFDIDDSFTHITLGAIFPAFEWGNSGPVLSE